MTLSIAPLVRTHWPAVERIYAAGIATGHATFESSPPTWQEFNSSKIPTQRFVALDSDRVVGWAAAVPVSERCVYQGVVEHSVYVDPASSGRGVGAALLDGLIASTEAEGVWTVQSGIFPENVASLRLHERAGFRTVGRRERLGLMTYGPMSGQWRDVVMIERRSPLTGT